jgi:hypothetical protein
MDWIIIIEFLAATGYTGAQSASCQMCIRAVSSGIKRLECKTDHLPPSSDEGLPLFPPIRRHAVVGLVTHMDNF